MGSGRWEMGRFLPRRHRGTEKRVHVMPVGDTEIHAGQACCDCKPTEVEPGVWVHHAWDCREARERLTGEACSDGWLLVYEFVNENKKSK